LNVHPSHIFFCVTRLFGTLGVIELHEEYADKEIQEEKGNEEDDDDKPCQVQTHWLPFYWT